MTKLLVVVDMQNDFINGSLGSKEAQAIVSRVADKIRNWGANPIIATQDTHAENYLETQEGKNLPVKHCIVGTEGWELNIEIKNAFGPHNYLYREKNTFGCTDLVDLIENFNPDEIEFVGLCTDICVVSNVLLVKAFYPEIKLIVDSSCCAGTSVEAHEAALKTMRSCQVEVR